MFIPTRQEAIATLKRGSEALEALLAYLSPDEMTRRATIGYGDWSAKDLMGHIAFWEELAVEALADWRAGRRPEPGHFGDEGTDAANARNQERSAAQQLNQVRRRADAAHHAILDAINAMPDAEWLAQPPYTAAQHATLGELLGAVLAAHTGPFEHAFAHLEDLRTYVDSLRRP